MTVQTSSQTLVAHFAQALGEAFGTQGGAQAYNVEIAEKIALALQDENYSRSMVESIVYDGYMDAVAARQIAEMADENFAG